jgi:serine/threonine protein kinase
MNSGGGAAPDQDDPRIGRVVRGKWRIDALLGVGGMACVYSATHNNGRRAALKILHPELAHDAGLRERFLREGYVGNKIGHPGRVDVLDHDTTEEGEPFLVMELLLGETLDQRWKRYDRRLPVIEALEVAAELLDFLSVCHAAAIIHRDLKPANVFLCTPEGDPTALGHVKVLDFGIAQLRDQTAEQTRAGTALGTPSYMSPEQARGLGDSLDGRSDIFSVGALLHALVTGARLHQGRSNDEALILAATQPAPSIARIAPELPHEFIALVDKALQWDRRNRHANAQEMHQAVLAVLASLRAPSPSVAPSTSTRMIVSSAVGMRAAEPAAPSSSRPRTLEGEAAVAEEEARLAEAAQRLRALCKALERLLPNLRQYGSSHPESERRLRALFEEILAVHATEPALALAIRPYSFATVTTPAVEVWEPLAPLDVVPYALFESGLRVLRLVRGVTEPEVRALVELFLLDPERELAPEDDLATRLWELGLPHVEVEKIDGVAEGNAAQRASFHHSAHGVQRLAEAAVARAERGKRARADHAEAKAMAVATDDVSPDAGASTIAAATSIDPTTRLALGNQLAVPSARWSERYLDVLVDAWLETRRHGDPGLLDEALRTSIAELVTNGKVGQALSLHQGLHEVIAVRCSPAEVSHAWTAVTAAMFGGATLPAVLDAILAAPPGSDERGTLLSKIGGVLEHLDDASLPIVLTALEGLAAGDAELRAALLAYVERVLDGNERAVAARLGKLPQEVARELLAMLGRRQSADAVSALADIAAGSDLALRVEAIAQRADGPEQRRQELAALLDHARADVRLAALRATAQHRVRELGPALVRRVEDPGFHALPLDERRQILATLHALHPTRAETLAADILAQKGVLRSETRDQTRLLAAQLLADHGRSRAALDALSGAAKGWWGNSDELRAIAQEGVGAISARLEHGDSPKSNPPSGGQALAKDDRK